MTHQESLAILDDACTKFSQASRELVMGQAGLQTLSTANVSHSAMRHVRMVCMADKELLKQVQKKLKLHHALNANMERYAEYICAPTSLINSNVVEDVIAISRSLNLFVKEYELLMSL